MWRREWSPRRSFYLNKKSIANQCLINSCTCSSLWFSDQLILKLKTIYKCLFSVPIKGRAQCYASFHSNIHKYLWSDNTDKALQHFWAWFLINFVFQTLQKIYKVHVLGFNFYKLFYLRCKWFMLPVHLQCNWMKHGVEIM